MRPRLELCNLKVRRWPDDVVVSVADSCLSWSHEACTMMRVLWLRTCGVRTLIFGTSTSADLSCYLCARAFTTTIHRERIRLCPHPTRHRRSAREAFIFYLGRYDGESIFICMSLRTLPKGTLSRSELSNCRIDVNVRRV